MFPTWRLIFVCCKAKDNRDSRTKTRTYVHVEAEMKKERETDTFLVSQNHLPYVQEIFMLGSGMGRDLETTSTSAENKNIFVLVDADFHFIASCC